MVLKGDRSEERTHTNVRRAIFGTSHSVKVEFLTQIYIWCPGIDRGIEDLVHCCESCQLVTSMPPVAPLQL